MNSLNNFKTQKSNIDSYLNYLYPEKLFHCYISEDEPKLYLNSYYLYYKYEDLILKIKSIFGEPKDEFENEVFFINKKEFSINEKAFLYEDFLITLKGKNYDIDLPTFLRPSNNDDDDDDENEKGEIQEEGYEKIKIDLLGKTIDKSLKEKFKQILSFKTELKRKKSELSILCHSSYEGFYLKNLTTLPTTIDLKKYYNDGFEEVAEYVVERLNKKDDKGIILFHGTPGTGKTNFIRYLTRKIKDKTIIYIPPDFAINISNPDFITFFISHPNSILVIEDAENILKSRTTGGNQAVSNLLSISDGLLGDGVRLQLLCTFNSSITEIDEALLREGRLIAEYKFEKLTVEKAQQLTDELFPENEKITITTPMTLGEVFNQKEKRFITHKKQTNIGFQKK